MCKRNSPDTNKASTGCVRETPQIKIVHNWVVCSPPWIRWVFSARGCSLALLSLGVSFLAICRAVFICLFLKRSVSSGSLSLSRFLVILFVFVLLNGAFCKAVFRWNLGFRCFVFYHFEGSFHFWALLCVCVWGGAWGWGRGLVLRPVSTLSSLMSFSPCSCFLWLLCFLVASFFCSLLSKAS